MEPPNELIAKALERFNFFRKTAGVNPVTLDPVLYKGCDAHAKYLIRNIDHPTIAGWRGDQELPDLPGYTPEGREAATTAYVQFDRTDPLGPLDLFMALLYFRLHVLDTDLQRIGLAIAKHETKGWVCVLDVLRGRGSNKVICYPIPNQKDVPLEFTGEVPDPIPEAKGKPAGFPITVTFPRGQSVKQVSAVLKEESSGKEVEHWLSTPEKPASLPQAQQNTICLIAKRPLVSGTTYLVAIKAQVHGKGWEKTWRFTTGTLLSVNMDITGDTPLERINAFRKLVGIAPVTLAPALSLGCKRHAEYLLNNSDHPSTVGLGAHNEDPKLPGYTKEGAKAGKAAVIFFLQSSNLDAVKPASTIDGFVDTFFHRIPLFDPDLKRVGFGFAKGKRIFVVLDVLNGFGTDQPVIYPVDKQTEVPLVYRGLERPSPIEELKDKKDKKAGYPITVTFPRSIEVTKVTAQLKDAKGAEVPIYLTTPEKSVDPGLQRNTVALFAQSALTAGSTYTVTVQADLSGEVWKRTWSFTTAGK
jgi:uncharacterized protein YkwD